MIRSILIVALATAGCHRAPTPPPSELVVTLKDPGRQPTRAVGYRPIDHARVVRFKTDGMTTSYRWELDGAGATGSRYRFTLTKLEHPDPAGEGEAAIEESLIGNVTGTVAGDDHGRATAVNDSDRYRISPSIPDLAGMMIVPLPAEPIGVGAHWTVTGHPMAGLPVTIAVDYEALAIDTDGASVRWTGQFAADATGEILSKVAGSMTLHFDDLMPIRGEVRQTPTPSPGSTKQIELTMSIE